MEAAALVELGKWIVGGVAGGAVAFFGLLRRIDRIDNDLAVTKQVLEDKKRFLESMSVEQINHETRLAVIESAVETLSKLGPELTRSINEVKELGTTLKMMSAQQEQRLKWVEGKVFGE